ncbi:hypothetical protein [Ferrimonas kyonanensis]|uniref:hypothetical protein n=1 Tax=Ferrimonas kyonanensis TaxID=364763 RepID=UPI000488DD08|nr:hypothetical protein [Ferrimonas kyonanensis]
MEQQSRIEEKLDIVRMDVDRIVALAHAHLKTDISGGISFRYEISAPRDVLTDFERAQSICFVARFDALPTIESVNVNEVNGKFYLNNVSEIRSALNEYRSIVQNKKDSIHYQKIHKFCREKLLNADHSKDLSITVNHESRGDITQEFAKYLDESCKAIRTIINHCEFGYIYNGILQHSDHRFSSRFLEEYSSGEANYTFIKHAFILGHIRELLSWHHRLYSALTFPKLGAM